MNKTATPMPAAGGGRHKTKNDVIFITALLLVVSLAGACFFFIRGEGDSVKVTVDGKLYGCYSLSQDTRVELRTGPHGEQLNVLVIEKGKARVETATCPDGICADHRPISRNGESIACLPHKVVIAVYTSDSDSDPDVIV